MYSMWSVVQLKAELKRRGASLRGRKADLVSRLESFDRNCNFGVPQLSFDTEDVSMDLPPPEKYHDVNSSTVLPPLAKHHIRLYFHEFNKKPDDGLKLYESRYLVTIRACKCNDYTFIKAVGKASMKRLQYEINLKIHSSGNIEGASCECVAGSGTTAHCKHVAMALFAMENMVRDKTIIKHLTPTEKLQKFHMPKNVFTSTPLKSSGLPMKRKLDNVIFSPCSIKVNKLEYNQYFRNVILNYTSSNMPMKQIYEPANPYGVEWDHSYCGEDSEIIIKNLNIESITPEAASLIEAETHGQILNKQWMTHRKYRITASKFHTICHLKHSSQEKYAKQLIEQGQFTSRATSHGIINENVALQLYMEKNDLEVVSCGLFIPTDRPYLAASPDGLLGDETIVEIKCPYTTRNELINNVTVPYLTKGEIEGQYKLKHGSPYYYQIQGQLYCSNRKYCNLIIYTYKDLKVIFIDRDDEFITGMLLMLDQFYFSVFKPAVLNNLLYKNYLETIKRN